MSLQTPVSSARDEVQVDPKPQQVFEEKKP